MRSLQTQAFDRAHSSVQVVTVVVVRKKSPGLLMELELSISNRHTHAITIGNKAVSAEAKNFRFKHFYCR